jgi:hypothetical protein
MSLKLLTMIVSMLLALPMSGVAQLWNKPDTSHTSGEQGHYLHRRPSISLLFGGSRLKRKDLSSTFAKPPVAKMRIGLTDEWMVTNYWEDSVSTGILKEDSSWLSLANISTEIGNKSTSGDINTDAWRIGAGAEQGYGYPIGNASAIIPYNAMAFDWTRLRLNSGTVITSDSSILQPFDGTFRFGTSVEGGIKFQIVSLLTADVAYERAVVFPAHLFWKWAGSTVIEIASQAVMDEFVNRVMDNSPGAVPVVNFLLKSGISYGVYELRKDKMNWPFNSTPPLTIDSFKAGLTFIF